MLSRSASTLRASLRQQARAFTSATESFTLPDLPYDYSELNPHIIPEIMELHHGKHHNTYVTNLNAAVEQYQDAQNKGDIAKMTALLPAINFNGGGHLNHSLFWTMMAPPSKGGGGEPTGELAAAITAEFGSFDNFKAQMAAKSVGVQGAGWGWLGYDTAKGRVGIATCANQDPLTTMVPLLGIDVWEHAYYLQYKNVRPDYVSAMWNVVNWANVAERFEAAKSS